jgi:hypothetical protein
MRSHPALCRGCSEHFIDKCMNQIREAAKTADPDLILPDEKLLSQIDAVSHPDFAAHLEARVGEAKGWAEAGRALNAEQRQIYRALVERCLFLLRRLMDVCAAGVGAAAVSGGGSSSGGVWNDHDEEEEVGGSGGGSSSTPPSGSVAAELDDGEVDAPLELTHTLSEHLSARRGSGSAESKDSKDSKGKSEAGKEGAAPSKDGGAAAAAGASTGPSSATGGGAAAAAGAGPKLDLPDDIKFAVPDSKQKPAAASAAASAEASKPIKLRIGFMAEPPSIDLNVPVGTTGRQLKELLRKQALQPGSQFWLSVEAREVVDAELITRDFERKVIAIMPVQVCLPAVCPLHSSFCLLIPFLFAHFALCLCAAQQRAAFNTLPTYLIANSSQNFDLLFSLLETSDHPDSPSEVPSHSDGKKDAHHNGGAFSLTQKVWELLMQLPLNQGAVNRLRQLQATVPAPASSPASSPASAPASAVPTAGGDAKAVAAPALVVDWKTLLDPTVCLVPLVLSPASF